MNLLPACCTSPSDQAQSTLMMSCPCRQWTLSIAVPGSVIDNTQTVEQATAIAGQIARAAAIFNVDEVRWAVCQLPLNKGIRGSHAHSVGSPT